MNSFLSRIKIFSAAVTAGCFFVLSCENKQKDIDEATKRLILEEEARNIETFLSLGGEMRAKLTSPLLRRSQGDTIYSEFPQSLHVDFYDDSARVETELSALYGKYYEILNKVYLRDSVVVFNVKGDTLRCPEMWWDQDRQKFYNDTTWQLDTKGGTHLKGDSGFEASQDLRTIIFKQPKGVFPMADSVISN
jgi:hypothetical protein